MLILSVGSEQEADTVRDLPVSTGDHSDRWHYQKSSQCLQRLIFFLSAKVSIFPRLVPRVEKLRASQPLPQRVLHQAAQGAWQVKSIK